MSKELENLWCMEDEEYDNLYQWLPREMHEEVVLILENIKLRNWSGLSGNHDITLEFIERHIDKPWSWGYNGLSSNSSITPEFIERLMDKP